jgi:competence protein ComGC
MKNLKRKAGSTVIQMLIIISIMGLLCITLNAAIVNKANARSEEAVDSILESEKIDIEKLVGQG